MIEKMLIEEGHYNRLNKLTPSQKKEYNNILAKVENEKDSYIVAVDLTDPHFGDCSVICKYKYKDGVFHLEESKYIKPEDGHSNLKEGLYIGGHRYEKR